MDAGIDLAEELFRGGVPAPRRRRRAWALVTGGALAAAVLVPVLLLTGAVVLPREQLQMGAGRGPDARSVIAASAGQSSGSVWGVARVLRPEPDVDGRSVVAYVSPEGNLCVGSAASGKDDPRPSVCAPIGALPQDGLAAGLAYAPASTAQRSSTIIALGIVRGPVNEVQVSSALGTRTAHLAALPDADVGLLYWVDTGVPAQSPEALTIRRTVLLDGSARFGCTDSEPGCS